MKVIYRVFPILIVFSILVSIFAFPVSAAGVSSGTYDYIENASAFEVNINNSGFVTTPIPSTMLTTIPESLTFRVYVSTSNTYEQFVLGFYAPYDLNITNVYVSHNYYSAELVSSSTDSFYGQKYSQYKINMDGVYVNSLGYIDVTLTFDNAGASYSGNISLAQFYGIMYSDYTITADLPCYQNLLYFHEVNGKITAGMYSNNYAYHIGSLLMSAVPFSQYAGVSTNTYYFDITRALLPLKNVGQLVIPWVSVGSSDLSVNVMDSNGNILYSIDPEISSSIARVVGDVEETYGQWNYTAVVDVSKVDFSSGEFIRFTIQLDVINMVSTSTYYSSLIIPYISVVPYEAPSNIFASFWFHIKNGFDSVVDAITSIFPGSSEGQQFLEDAEQKREELDAAQSAIDSVERPELSYGDISGIVNPVDAAAYGNVFASVLGSNIVTNILFLLGTFMLVGYVLFGKK